MVWGNKLKFSDKNRNVNLELPVKISCDGKDYYIKRATKTTGIYLNSEPPKDQPERKENEDNKKDWNYSLR